MRLVIVGGSDAGISAALRARELSADTRVSVVLADGYPNFSICGIPYHVSGEVPDWRTLAHRSKAELAATGVRLITDTTVTAIDPASRQITIQARDGASATQIGYDRLIVGTGAVPQQPPIAGLDVLGSADGVHVLHTMGDTFALTDSLVARAARTVVIIGAGYIGLEMAEALTHRGLTVTILERLDQVLPRTLDPDLAELIAAELRRHRVQVTAAPLSSASDATRARWRSPPPAPGTPPTWYWSSPESSPTRRCLPPPAPGSAPPAR